MTRQTLGAQVPGVFARRAAKKATRFAMLPPLTRSPPPAANPTSSASQRTVCPSISLARGDSSHPPTFGFTAEAKRSASAPSGAADEVM